MKEKIDYRRGYKTIRDFLEYSEKQLGVIVGCPSIISTELLNYGIVISNYHQANILHMMIERFDVFILIDNEKVSLVFEDFIRGEIYDITLTDCKNYYEYINYSDSTERYCVDFFVDNANNTYCTSSINYSEQTVPVMFQEVISGANNNILMMNQIFSDIMNGNKVNGPVKERKKNN